MFLPDEPNIEGKVPGALTAESAAEVFGILAHPARPRVIGLALATNAISVDELQVVLGIDRADLLAHLDALTAKRIITVAEVNGVSQVSASSAYTDDFVNAARAWLTDLLGGPVVKV
jgi:DNA-binding transcriptional ArsR family regulator